MADFYYYHNGILTFGFYRTLFEPIPKYYTENVVSVGKCFFKRIYNKIMLGK